jgi:hypothetical protein
VPRRFNLVTIDGDLLGSVELAREEWPAGSVIYRGGVRPNLRVVAQLPPATAGQTATLVVTASYPDAPEPAAPPPV